jgi:deoxyribonuclease-4
MDHGFRIGLKLYSTNMDLIKDASILYKGGFFHYVELYIIPGSFEKTIESWKAFEAPFVIHAPHAVHGINLARADMFKDNQRNFREAQRFADFLGCEIIIVHGGNNGSFDETIRQIALLDEKRIALENKPKMGLKGEICVGYAPSDFHRAKQAGVLYGTVLDFGHAACVARSLDIEVMDLVQEFMDFDPKIFHLVDGESSSESDTHLNFGKGNLNIDGFISVIPDQSMVTLETPRDPSNGLDDFVSDIEFLRNNIRQR